MAETHGMQTMPVECAGDLSTKQFYLAKLDANGKAVIATAGACIGAIQNIAKSTAEPAQIPIGGTAKVICAGALAPNVVITSDANGKAVAAVENDISCGVLVGVSAAADDIVEYLVSVAKF